MNCPYCNAILQIDSTFCMHCGKRITISNNTDGSNNIDVLQHKLICNKCNKPNPLNSEFCSSCGYRFKRANSISLDKKYYVIFGAVLIAIICIVLGGIYKSSLKSPIDGVSKKVYIQGQTFLRQMDTENVEKAVDRYLDDHTDESVNDIYKHVPGVNFQIELGKNPTVEEVYYSQLIDKFWMAKATCYCHRSLMKEYEENDNDGVQFALTLYKGIVSDFETGIKNAERQLDNAKNLSDMEDAYDTLDNIWDSEE